MKSKFKCPVCGRDLEWQYGEQVHPDNPAYGVTVWCPNNECRVIDPGHGKTEQKAAEWLAYLFGKGEAVMEDYDEPENLNRAVKAAETLSQKALAQAAKETVEMNAADTLEAVPGIPAILPAQSVPDALERQKNKKETAFPVSGPGEFTIREYSKQHGMEIANANNLIQKGIKEGTIKALRQERRNAKGKLSTVYAMVEGMVIEEKKPFLAPPLAPSEFTVKIYAEQQNMSLVAANIMVNEAVKAGTMKFLREERRNPRGPMSRIYTKA